MNITEFVAEMLEGATTSQLESIIINGVKVPDDLDDMREKLENEFVDQTKEILRKPKTRNLYIKE